MADPFQNQMPIKPDYILDIIIRRKWIIIIPLCIVLTVGLYKTLTASKTYEASTLILVQPQRVPTNYVKSIVTSTINQRISTISQQILSRSNLEKIIDQFGLYEGAEDMYLEDKIAGMRRRVQVKIERARHGAEAFSIVFTGSEPQRVMRIANTLASYFMDENLKVREAQAVGTSEFLDSELEKTRKKLEHREQQLAAYKNNYIGGLPSELATNLSTLSRLQVQLTNKQVMLKELRNSLNMLQTQIAQTKEMAFQSFDDSFSIDEFGDDTGAADSENQQKIDAAQRQIDSLLLRYTEKHPDVKKLKKIIQKLEQTIVDEQTAAEKAQEEISEDEIEEDGASVDGEGLGSMPNFAAMQQELQLKQIRDEIAKNQSDIAKIEGQMALYQKRVEDTPKRELELQSLQRDYTNIQGVFNSLLDRKLEAELSVTMEKKQKGEQFRILDHARLPEKPITPNVKMLFMMSIAIGLGIGGGIIFLLEFFDNSIRREEQIEEDLGLNILAIIPPLKKPGQKLKKRLEMGLFVCCSLYAVMFLSFFAVLNYKGLDRTINLIKSTFNI